MSKPANPDTAAPDSPRDLADFHLRWPAFRPDAQAILTQAALTDAQATTLRWLIAMADRIGAPDITGP